jgi:hypothetical protein
MINANNESNLAAKAEQAGGHLKMASAAARAFEGAEGKGRAARAGTAGGCCSRGRRGWLRVAAPLGEGRRGAARRRERRRARRARAAGQGAAGARPRGHQEEGQGQEAKGRRAAGLIEQGDAGRRPLQAPDGRANGAAAPCGRLFDADFLLL